MLVDLPGFSGSGSGSGEGLPKSIESGFAGPGPSVWTYGAEAASGAAAGWSPSASGTPSPNSGTSPAVRTAFGMKTRPRTGVGAPR